jgi:hypothetical protein
MKNMNSILRPSGDAVFSLLIMVMLLLISGILGAKLEENYLSDEAVSHGCAHWIVSSGGCTTFVWNKGKK